MTQVLAGFSDHNHYFIVSTYPIFPCRTTNRIVCCHFALAVFLILGGTILDSSTPLYFWLGLEEPLSLGAVSTAAGAVLSIPTLPENL